MTSPNALQSEVRLMFAPALREQLSGFDEDRFARFRQALRFAERGIARRTRNSAELPAYLIIFDDFLLVIEFDRKRERFVLRAVFELDSDVPPPGASAPLSSLTAAETVLLALGVDPSETVNPTINATSLGGIFPNSHPLASFLPQSSAYCVMSVVEDPSLTISRQFDGVGSTCAMNALESDFASIGAFAMEANAFSVRGTNTLCVVVYPLAEAATTNVSIVSAAGSSGER